MSLNELETQIYEWAQRARRDACAAGRRTARASTSAGSTTPTATPTAVIVNPGAWTHYSYAIHDALEILDGADRRGAPLEHPGARGMAAALGDRRRRRAPRDRQGARRATARRSRTSPAQAHDRRLDALRARLDEPLLVTNLVNIRYLTGFDTSNAALLVEPGRARPQLFTDFRYIDSAREQVPGVEARAREALAAARPGRAPRRPHRRSRRTSCRTRRSRRSARSGLDARADDRGRRGAARGQGRGRDRDDPPRRARRRPRVRGAHGRDVGRATASASSPGGCGS